MDLGKNTCGFVGLKEQIRVDGRKGSCQFQDLVVPSSGHGRNVGRKSEASVPFLDFRGKVSLVKLSCEDDRSYVAEERVEGNNGSEKEKEKEKEKEEYHWHRVKWTDQMVKLLITIISYAGEDASVDHGVRSGGRSSHSLTKKGKWKAVSKVMDERGFHVSPQQCEDKFNDLNKRYKKLNDLLGRGTSCKVVEKPALLDLMDISDKDKESARKILCSKQLFFEEMCSYQNGNRLFIPHDASVQRSLQMALANTDNTGINEAKANRSHDYEGDEENSCSYSPRNNLEATVSLNRDLGSVSMPAKRKKLPTEHESMNIKNAAKKSASSGHARIKQAPSHAVEGDQQGNHCSSHQDTHLEEQKLHIEAEMLELEKQRLKWLKNNELEDRVIEKMRLDNEHLRLENEQLAFEIKRRHIVGGAN